MNRSPSRASALLIPTLCLMLSAGCPPDDGSVPQAFPVLADEPGSKAVSAPKDDDREVIRVCTILPSSGVSKDLGAEIRRGIDIARTSIDPEGKRRFEWTDRDTKSTEPGALAAFQGCFNEGHHIIIGPVHPAATTALIPVAASHQVVLIVPEVGAAVPGGWGTNLVAIAPAATEMGRIAGRNARVERGFTRGAVLHVPKVFGEGLRDAFTKEFLAVEDGGTIVGARELAPDKPEAWAEAALDFAKQGAEAIFVVGPPAVSKAVAAIVPKSGAHAWFVDWSMMPPVLDAAGSEGRGQVHWVNRSLPTGDFASIYRERHQAKPEGSAGAGYDAVRITELASNAAKSTWFEDLSAEIGKLKGIPSAFGTGEIVNEGGIVFLDLAGYRMVEPVPLADTDEWVFGGFE